MRAHVARSAPTWRRASQELAPPTPSVTTTSGSTARAIPTAWPATRFPWAARVVAVADVVAYLLPAAHGDPRARKAAAHRLRELAGPTLDPGLVTAAIAVLAAEAQAAGEYLPRTA